MRPELYMDQVCLMQGGMGVGISTPGLARSVALAGEGKTAGITSATLAGHTAASRLAEGDHGYHEALAAFGEIIPEAAELIRAMCVGRESGRPIGIPLYTRGNQNPKRVWPSIFGAFAVTYLAAKGHAYPIGINVLEKVQQPHLEEFMGVLLADAVLRERGLRVERAPLFIIAGAGLPWQFPSALASLAEDRRAEYCVDSLVRDHTGAEKAATYQEVFDLHELVRSFGDATRKRLARMQLRSLPVIAIVTTFTAVRVLEKKANGKIAGYVVEGPDAGGHNAPPRDKVAYGPKDHMDFEALRALKVPFWVAGDYASHERLLAAKNLGAVGVQVGTLFSLAVESGYSDATRHQILTGILAGTLVVERDDRASPTGFPFNVARVEGSAGDPVIAQQWMRSCDIGHLRVAIDTPHHGRVIYRCSAEPVTDFVRKGGNVADTEGRHCLCRQLAATGGVVHHLRRDLADASIITMGIHGMRQVRDLLGWLGYDPDEGVRTYSACDVVRYMCSVPLGGS